jgi:two-component system, OmpR family, response regulator QseB
MREAFLRESVMRLLLVEDDLLLGNGIQVILQGAGYAVDWLTDGEAALHALNIETFDGAVLDLNLPRKSGLEILKHLRSTGKVLPVLILTARDTLQDKISGLDLGADDYMVKPFEIDELLARLRALLRRSKGRATTHLEYKELRLDPNALLVTLHNEIVTMSNKEFSILQTLLENVGHIISRQRLEESIYAWDNMVESNAIEVHIHHLRRKLGKNFIKTIRGMGYIIPK